MTDSLPKEPLIDDELINLTSDIVSAYVRNHALAPADLPDLIETVHSTLSMTARQPEEFDLDKPTPAVPVESSVTRDYIVCLEDRKRFKSLKRHLHAHHDMTPEEYRAKWNLPWHYPMVAPNYTTIRSKLAKKMGLGRKKARS